MTWYQVNTTSASTPQTAVKSEGKTQHSPSPKGPGGVTPDNTPPKSQSVTPLNMSQSADLCVPIAQLTMYQRPTIKGRIANKDSVRAFKGRDGTEKKVFSVEIMDETCDMKVTFWDKAADKFYDVLEVQYNFDILIRSFLFVTCLCAYRRVLLNPKTKLARIVIMVQECCCSL